MNRSFLNWFNFHRIRDIAKREKLHRKNENSEIYIYIYKYKIYRTFLNVRVRAMLREIFYLMDNFGMVQRYKPLKGTRLDCIELHHKSTTSHQTIISLLYIKRQYVVSFILDFVLLVNGMIERDK